MMRSPLPDRLGKRYNPVLSGETPDTKPKLLMDVKSICIFSGSDRFVKTTIPLRPPRNRGDGLPINPAIPLTFLVIQPRSRERQAAFHSCPVGGLRTFRRRRSTKVFC